jgi:ribosomal protein L14
MAVIGKIVTGTTMTSPTTVYTSSGNNAVTCIAICNTGTISLTDETSESVDINIYIVSPSGGSDNTEITGGTAKSLVVKQLTVPAGETVFFNDEKFVLANNDYIAVGYQMSNAASPVTSLLNVTVSTLPV